jgi:FixJ family two-component response regulator
MMVDFILFVDDEEKILTSLERELDEWLEERSLSFRSAPSVDAALEILSKEHESCAAIVSDLKMPHKKGSDLLLSAASRWPLIATILLTGFSDMDEIKDCIRAGIVSFMQKPWNGDILKAELERVTSLTRLRKEHADYLRRLERDVVWTRRLHAELLMNERLPGGWGRLDIAARQAKGSLECGGDLVLSFLSGDGSLFLCFGSLAVTGVEGTYHGTKIRETLIVLGNALTRGEGPDALLSRLNHKACAELTDLPENSLSLSVFRFAPGDEFFSCTHAGGEHFALVEAGRIAEYALPSPVLGLKDGVEFPVKRYAFRDATTLVLYSRRLRKHADTESRFFRSLEDAAGDIEHRTAKDILASIVANEALPFDSTLALFRKA